VSRSDDSCSISDNGQEPDLATGGKLYDHFVTYNGKTFNYSRGQYFLKVNTLTTGESFGDQALID